MTDATTFTTGTGRGYEPGITPSRAGHVTVLARRTAPDGRHHG